MDELQDTALKARIRAHTDSAPPLKAGLPADGLLSGPVRALAASVFVLVGGAVTLFVLGPRIVNSDDPGQQLGGDVAHTVEESTLDLGENQLAVELRPALPPVTVAADTWTAPGFEDFIVIDGGFNSLDPELLVLDAITGEVQGRASLGGSPEVVVDDEARVTYVVSDAGLDAYSLEGFRNIYSVDIGQRMRWTRPNAIPLIALSTDGSLMFVHMLRESDPDVLPWGDQSLMALDTSTGRPIGSEADLNGCQSPMTEAIGPSTVAVACYGTNDLRVIDFTAGQPELQIHRVPISSREGEPLGIHGNSLDLEFPAGLHLAADTNSLLVVSRNGYIAEFDLDEGRFGEVTDLGFSNDEWIPEGATAFGTDGVLALGVGSVNVIQQQTGDRDASAVILLDVTAETSQWLSGIGPVNTVALTRDSLLVAGTESGVIRVFDRSTGDVSANTIAIEDGHRTPSRIVMSSVRG